MKVTQAVGEAAWAAARDAALFLAVDPCGLGGIRLDAAPGPAREAWLRQFQALLPAGAPVRRMPAAIDADRLIGGLDLAASLQAGRPVEMKGLLCDVDGGVLIAAMAERMSASAAANISAALDERRVRLERGGLSRTYPSTFCVVLLDESTPDEAPPAILVDRIAFHVRLAAVSIREIAPFGLAQDDIAAARASLGGVSIGDDLARAINTTALALGVVSLRALAFAFAATRCAAALAGRRAATEDDAARALPLVLAWRSQASADAPPEDDKPPPEPPEAHDPPPDLDPDTDVQDTDTQGPLEDRLVEAVRAVALGEIWKHAQDAARPGRASAASGGAGREARSHRDGAPVGVAPGDPRRDGRLDLVATMRAAAPWQTLRRQDGESATRIAVRASDFRVKRFRRPTETAVIFVVDASGSSAMNRMAEAKGAIELMLTDCYARRDHVALVAFRDRTAEVLLPPTRSLVRVRRTLSQLPGGGGTPLAAGLLAAETLAEGERRRSRSPFLVILSDGKGNIGLDREPGRERAERDALGVAARLRMAGLPALFFDTSIRPEPKARRLSAELGAHYRPLPFASASQISADVAAAIGRDGVR